MKLNNSVLDALVVGIVMTPIVYEGHREEKFNNYLMQKTIRDSNSNTITDEQRNHYFQDFLRKNNLKYSRPLTNDKLYEGNAALASFYDTKGNHVGRSSLINMIENYTPR